MKRLFIFLLANVLLLSSSAAYAQDSTARYRTRVSQQTSGEYTQDDTSEEITFGREVAARVLGTFNYRRDAALQHYLNLVGQTLVSKLNRPELDFHFAAVDSDEVNAYASPGGYVFITTAALKLMENEAELAGVIAHEIGHINARHIVRDMNLRATDTGAMSSIAAILRGGSDTANVAFAQAVGKAVDIIFRDGYRREDEMEADRNALFYCALSGYDPRGLVTYLKKVAAAKGKLTVGKTYPQYDQRLELLEKSIADEKLAELALFTGEQRLAASLSRLR